MNTRERRNPFPDDQRLRKAGWEILARPRVGPDVWVHWSGTEMTFEEAIKHETEKWKELAIAFNNA